MTVMQPLGHVKAVGKAIELKNAGLRWSDVSYVMRVYHGVARVPGTWRKICRQAGLRPTPHGLGDRNFR